MPPSLTRSVKTLTIVFAALAFLSLGSGVVRADSFLVAYNTRGCLQPCTPKSAPLSFTTGGLTFNRAVVSKTLATGNLIGVSFGTFKLASTADTSLFEGREFSLLLTFTSPVGSSGRPPLLLTSLFNGVIEEHLDGLFVNFLDNSTRTINFSNGTIRGSFTLTVSDTFILLGGAGNISGQVGDLIVEPVPEPATLLLLATGLAGAAASARRRLRRGPH